MAKVREYDVSRIEALKGVMKRYLKKSGIGWMLKHRDVVDAWNSAAGPQIGACTRVRGCRGGVLHINVESGALRAELEQFHAPSILEALKMENERLGIRKLRFHLATLDPGLESKSEEA